MKIRQSLAKQRSLDYADTLDAWLVQHKSCLFGDSLVMAWKLLGNVEKERNDLSKSLRCYREGLKALQMRYFDMDIPCHEVGDLLHVSANRFAALGGQDSAAWYAAQAVLAKRRCHGLFSTEVAKSFSTLAQAYQNERKYNKALHYRIKVLAIRRSSPTVTAKDWAITYLNLGEAYLDVGKLRRAAIFLDSAEARLPALPQRDSVAYALYLLDFRGRLYSRVGNSELTRAALAQWESLDAETGTTDPAATANHLIQRGHFERESGDHGTALNSYHTALKIYAPGNDTLGPLALPPVEALGHQPNVFAALALKARAAHGHPDTAISKLFVPMADLAFAYLGELRRGWWQWDVRADITAQAQSEFEFCIRMAIGRGEQAKAFEWLERSKENELLDILQDLHRLNLTPIPADTVALARKYFANPEVYADSLRDLAEAVRRAYPGRLRPQPQFASLEAVRARLSDDSSVFVSFFWGPQYVIVAGCNLQRDTVLAIPITDSLQGYLDRFRGHLDPKYYQDENDNDAAGFGMAAYGLYQCILQPLWDAMGIDSIPPRIILAPHGPLATIPFEALTTAPPPLLADFNELPYLIDSTIISYVHSATIFIAYDSAAQPAPGVLGIGSSGGFRGQERIEHVDDEIRSVVGHLGGIGLIDEIDLEYRLKGQPPRAGSMQISSHGEYVPDAPLTSRIILPADPAHEEDGDLHAYEVMKLKLPYSMAVLSACETGPGIALQGKEWVSMGHAFQVAQCSTVVMSLWNVDDSATYEIMDGFYAQLAAGESAVGAFTQARRDFLSDASSKQAHPLYWAPWLMVGDGELHFTVGERPRSWAWVWVLGAGIIGGTAVVLWLLRRRKRFRWV